MDQPEIHRAGSGGSTTRIQGRVRTSCASVWNGASRFSRSSEGQVKVRMPVTFDVTAEIVRLPTLRRSLLSKMRRRNFSARVLR